MRFGLFFLAEYMSVFGVSCLGTVLFLGGGTPLPFSAFPASLVGSTTVSYWIVNAILLGVFFAKVCGFIFVMFWIRATLPRIRVDRLMNFAWKYLVPLAILNVLLAALWYEVVMRPGRPLTIATIWPLSMMWTGLANWLVGWLITGPVTLLVVWFVFWFNRKVRSAAEEVPTVTPARHLPAAAR
jgi:NADH-quinone oxidoreductase subunit H